MKRVNLLLRDWANSLLRKRLKGVERKDTISVTQILNNAIKMHAVNIGGRRVII